MLLQELTLRTGETEILGMTLYDGVRVVERDLGGEQQSLLLVGSRLHEPHFEGMIGFLPDLSHGVGALDAIQTAIENGQAVVDMRGVLRAATEQERAFLDGQSQTPDGAERMTPDEAAEFLRSKGVDPATQGLQARGPTGQPGPSGRTGPQGGTGVVQPPAGPSTVQRPQARPVVARPAPR